MAEGLTVEVRGLTKRFGDREVLARLDLRIGTGEFVALLGRSGSGKSTLLPWRKVWRNVVLGLRGRGDDRALAEQALAEVQLADHADAWPRTLSGGEAQRVSLARALVREPDLLLLDEPFGALDALTRLAMHSLVVDLWETHRPSVLLVTHDVDEALLLADRVLILDGGAIVAEHELTHARPRRLDDHLDVRARVLTDLGVTDHASA
jgi:sulfonate transport system ATP-binding protein